MIDCGRKRIVFESAATAAMRSSSLTDSDFQNAVAAFNRRSDSSDRQILSGRNLS